MDEKEKDFLEGMSEETEQEEEVTPTPELETEEKGEEKPEASPAPETRKDETVPLAALKAEREKRQANERLIKELEAKLQKQEPAPNFFEAPEEYVKQTIQQVEQQWQQRHYAALEEQARESYPDYDEVFAEVQTHAAENPAAVHQILSSPNPAIAAYKLGKKLREFKAMQDPEAYRKQIEAEVRAQLEAEVRNKTEARQKSADSIPPDLATVRNAGADTAPRPESVFDEIFKE